MLSCYLHYSAATPRVSLPRVAAFDLGTIYELIKMLCPCNNKFPRFFPKP